MFGTENYAYRDILDDLFELASEINIVRNVYKVTRVGFLLDSSISSTYNVPDDPFDDTLKNGTEIYQFQAMLSKLLVYLTGTNRNYIVQFDEQKAW